MLSTHSRPKCKIIIGEGTLGTPKVISSSKRDLLSIGKFCSIGPNVVMIPSQSHILSNQKRNFRVSTSNLEYIFKKSVSDCFEKENFSFITVENDVWIGAEAIILPRVTVKNGAIIGAGAVVTHDVPPYAVVGGVPARIIKYRFSDIQIEELLKIAWWHWDSERIRENLEDFYGDIDLFLKKFGSVKL